MGWITDVLSLNAKVFSLLSDVENLNKRMNKVDEEIRDLGREISQLKGFLAGTQINMKDVNPEISEKIDQIQSKVDDLKSKLLLGQKTGED